MFYVISYDITNDKRRRLTVKYLESYGIRVQYSVFEAELSKEQILSLKKGINKVIDKKNDTVRIYPVCAECRKGIETIGINKGSYYDEEYIII